MAKHSQDPETNNPSLLQPWLGWSLGISVLYSNEVSELKENNMSEDQEPNQRYKP